jgi:HlyD family secretion protein
MKKRIVIGVIILIVAVLGIWWFVASRTKPSVPTVKATLGDVTSSVMVTGTTTPTQSVDLSFEQTGKVSAVYVNVGDKVTVGEPLVELEKSGLLAQLAQATASVASAQAQLDELKSGTRPEQIAIEEVRVANAQVALSQAQKSMMDTLVDANAKAIDIMHNKTDEDFTNPQTNDPTLNFSATDPQYGIDLVTEKTAIENALALWGTSLNAMTADSDLLSASADAKKYLSQIKTFIDKLNSALDTAIPVSAASQANVAVWKVDAGAARTELGQAISEVGAAETGLQTAGSALTLEQNNLALDNAGSTPDQIAAAQALVDEAKANVAGIQVQLGKTVLRSPIDGVITVQGAKLGQIVTVTTAAIANSSLISIISLKQLEIDADIPEVNIGSLALGQTVNITFDALPGENFTGSVMEIDPAETIIGGVVNYQIKIALDSTDPRIKSGLTANLSIITAVKMNVVLLPQYAILQNNGGTFVRVVSGTTTKDIPVKLGIRGQDGNVEIVSGVTEGESVQNIGLNPQ